MAKIKFGMMMTDASGKLGGQVFAKNRGGSYVRTKGIPTNPQTSFQTGVRGIFAAISSAWSSLTASQRLSWNNSVGAYAKTDIFGDLRNPSGKALFQRLNQNLQNVGEAVLNTCPQPDAVPFANLNGISGGAGAGTLSINTDGDTTGSNLLVFATPPLSQGTSFVKNDLRVIMVEPGDNGTTIAAGSAYVARFGAMTAGANIYVGIRVINANGQASPLEIQKATISA